MRGADGRSAQCPVCALRVPTGMLRAHVGSARCMATVGRAGVALTDAQRGLVTQGQDYEQAIRALTRVQAGGSS